MAFAQTSKGIHLDGAILHAGCRPKTTSSTYEPSKLNLDTVLGNKDGVFQWGGADFSKSANNLSVTPTGILSAELKRPTGNPVKVTVDLNAHIANDNGVLKAVNLPIVTKPEPSKPATPVAPPAATTTPTPLDTKPVTKTVIEEKVTSHVEKKTTEIRTKTMTMSLAESCRNFRLEGTVLVCECLLADGSRKTSRFDLDRFVGNIDGALVWHGKDFSKSSQRIRLEGTILRAECKRAKGNGWSEASFDLSSKLRNDDGVLMSIAYDEKLSVMLSEVPWMKFKVIAEPDFSVFVKHPVMQSTLTQIAKTTVEHVAAKFEALMGIALAETVKVVTLSAMDHVEQSLVVMTQNLSAGAFAHLHETHTTSGFLKSEHGVCGCQPFYCSCPPKSAPALLNGHATTNGYALKDQTVNGHALNGHALNGHAVEVSST